MALAVKYASLNPKVAVVDAAGNVTGVKAGTTTVTATLCRKTLRTSVKVVSGATGSSLATTVSDNISCADSISCADRNCGSCSDAGDDAVGSRQLY